MSDQPKPIVDLDAKPSRWRRFVAWAWALLPPPAPYRVIIVEDELRRVRWQALAAVVVALLVVAWVFWPRHG